MYIITRSLSTHFGGNLGYDSLKSAIKNAITTQFLAIQSYGDTVEFYFANTLSSPELATFDDIISNYVYTPDAKPKNSSISFTPKIVSTSNTSYTSLLTFKYLGSNNVGPINYIEVISYRDPAITNYDVRVVNHDTGAIIASRTGLTNTDYVANDLGAITNVPTAESILDLQVRKTGGPTNKYVYVDSVVVYN
jgi:hypothetical protein